MDIPVEAWLIVFMFGNMGCGYLLRWVQERQHLKRQDTKYLELSDEYSKLAEKVRRENTLSAQDAQFFIKGRPLNTVEQPDPAWEWKPIRQWPEVEDK